jgi:hypothetical protein
MYELKSKQAYDDSCVSNIICYAVELDDVIIM